MITRYQPSSSIELFTEGLNRRTADAATGRVVDRVSGHGHGEVLMGVKGNGGVVKDRP